MATTTDQTWAARIAQASGMAYETVMLQGEPKYRIRCLGADCPKYIRLTEGPDGKPVKADGVDSDASCKRVFILRAFLLDPQKDPNHPDYCRVLGLAEIASSSFNTMINLQSDFPMMKAFTVTGTSAGIPFRLERVPIQTFKPTRSIHFVLKVSLDYREVSRWGAIPMAERFQSEEMRARLRAIESTPLAASYDSVKDLIPPALLEAATEPETGGVVDPAAEPGAPVPGPSEPAEDGPTAQDRERKLIKSELDELKGLFTPSDEPEQSVAYAEGLRKLRDVIALYNSKHDTTYSRFSQLTYDVYLFVKQYVAGESGA
jgi:hypothetical protein